MRQMMAIGATPLAILFAGQLAENVFEPAMLDGGVLAAIFGKLVGTGAGRGVGLMFVMLGAFIAVAVARASSDARIRRLDEEVPDLDHVAV